MSFPCDGQAVGTPLVQLVSSGFFMPSPTLKFRSTRGRLHSFIFLVIKRQFEACPSLVFFTPFDFYTRRGVSF